MFDLLTALSLLMASPEQVIAIEENEVLRLQIQSLAVSLQIMDPRETRYLMIRVEDFHSDIKLLRIRYKDLAGAPLMEDSERFPNRSIVSEMLTKNREYLAHLKIMQDLNRTTSYWDYQTIINDTDWLYKVWDCVRDSRCEYYYVTVRRHALRKLIELVGPECYYEGTLPPPVPLYAYRQMVR